jgi:hypothetical protein
MRTTDTAETKRPQTRSLSDRGKKQRRSSVIDKSTLALPEPRRLRDREHVRYVTQKPCLICGRRPADAHHLRFAQNRALNRKVSDEFTVPLCRGHHREVHHSGDEAVWWIKAGLDPTITARALWLKTHPLPTTKSGVELAISQSRCFSVSPGHGRSWSAGSSWLSRRCSRASKL